MGFIFESGGQVSVNVGLERSREDAGFGRMDVEGDYRGGVLRRSGAGVEF
jgi:hypothetical protein